MPCHPGEEEEEGDSVVTSSYSPLSRTSRQRRRIFAEEVDKKEGEEELIMPHPSRQKLQLIPRSPTGGVHVGGLWKTPQVGTSAGAKGTTTANPAGHSTRVIEPRHIPCLLDSSGSSITQVELDQLSDRFHVPRVISLRAPKMGELPQQARRELGEFAFSKIALKCGVRLLLAPFVRRLLSKFPLHPLQVSPTL